MSQPGKKAIIIEPPSPTATRYAPRVKLAGKANFSVKTKSPMAAGVILNISISGALLFSARPVKEGSVIKVELGEPVFPVKKVLPSVVRHIRPAAEDLLTSLSDLKLVKSKQKGYLVGVEFIALKPEESDTLAKFIKKELKEEKKRREEDGTQNHTARDRHVVSKPPLVPSWSYGLGFLTGAYIFVDGLLNGADGVDIAIHVAITLTLFWAIGRVTSWSWNQMESWRSPEAIIVAASAADDKSLEEILDDADSHIAITEDEDEKTKKEEASHDDDTLAHLDAEHEQFLAA